jgi:diaminopimelate decarboxylase
MGPAAISARAGITLYRVLGIKHGATGRIFVTVNGGMSDNPRPSLYGARYTARLVGRKAAAGPPTMTVATSGGAQRGPRVGPRVRRHRAPRSRP